MFQLLWHALQWWEKLSVDCKHCHPNVAFSVSHFQYKEMPLKGQLNDFTLLAERKLILQSLVNGQSSWSIHRKVGLDEIGLSSMMKCCIILTPKHSLWKLKFISIHHKSDQNFVLTEGWYLFNNSVSILPIPLSLSPVFLYWGNCHILCYELPFHSPRITPSYFSLYWV